MLQLKLGDLLTFTEQNKMKIKIQRKQRLSRSIYPQNMTSSTRSTSLVKTLPKSYVHKKLLGVTLSSNLSRSPHIQDTMKKATKKLWLLVHFKSIGWTREQLLTIYELRTRSTLEFTVPVFHSGLSQNLSHKVEMVQEKYSQ